MTSPTTAETADPRQPSMPSLRLSEFDYELPEERIAQEPITPRDAARLLIVPRDTGPLTHRHFRDLPEYLRPEDVLVVNETRVTAVRLLGRREATGAAVETLILRPAIERGPDVYEALVRPGRKVLPGDALLFEEAGLRAEALDRTPSGGRLLQLVPIDPAAGSVTDLLEARGRVPLPPYITAPLTDRGRYQTVYARTPGSAAAPTAGLHFTPELLGRIEAMGVRIARVRLDVGLGTFRPIRTENVLEHEMHAETFAVSEATAAVVNSCRGRVVAVGTTSLRALETAAQSAAPGQRIAAVADGETRLFVYPGYRFRAVDALVTNFHQPHSTLLLLVAAIAGREQMQTAYRTALEEGYRFLSFGDAMFIQ